MKGKVRLFCALAASVFAAGTAERLQAADASAQVMNWVQLNAFAYNTYTQYANHPPAAQVPVPPQVNPPCHVCGDSTQTQGEQQVAAWVQQSENPEVQYAGQLLKMAHDLAVLDQLDRAQMSAGAQAALNTYSSDQAMNAAAALLRELFNNKVVPMANQYSNDPTRAYAGTKLVLDAAHQAALLDTQNSSSYDNQAIQLTQQWIQAVASKIDSDILSGHKYNLCPVYASIYRQVALLGGPEADASNLEETLNKIDQMMHFNIEIDLNGSAAAGQGGWQASWQAKGKLYLKVDPSNSCYTPQLDGGVMHVQVQNWKATGNSGSVTYVSPYSYDAPFKTPVVNLCDNNPVFSLPFDSNAMPKETFSAKGYQATPDSGSSFGGMLAAVATLNNLSGVNGKISSLTGRSSAPGQGAGSGPDLNSLQQQMQAHKNDPGWFMSAQGQQAISQMSQAMGGSGSTGGSSPQSMSNAGQNALSQSAIKATWTNGSTNPVSDSQHMTNSGFTAAMNIKVDPAQ